MRREKRTSGSGSGSGSASASASASFLAVLVVALVGVGAAGCGKGKSKAAPPPVAADAADAAARTDAAVLAAKGELPPAPPLPALPAGLPQPPAPPTPITAEQVELGRLLFSEVRLAADGKTSCASCHDAAAGYAGTRAPTALGRPNLRRAMPLVNAAWQREFGWDGRFASLEEHLPAHLHGQLGAAIDDALEPLAGDATLRAHFDRALDRASAPAGADATYTAIASLAAFVRTRYAGGARWDAEERLGSDEADPQLKAGYALFLGKAQCSVCHPPPLYTDLAYHRLGLIASPDEGRGRSDPKQRGAFKTPTLREAATRPRFFHDASATTLADAVDWHLAGGTGQGADASIIDPALTPITLTAEERGQLLAFLASLSGKWPPGK